jgi:hypothetical protein
VHANTQHPRTHSHAIVSSTSGPEYYVNMLSFVDKTQLEPGSTVLLHNKVMSVVGILGDDADPMVSVMKVRACQGHLGGFWLAVRENSGKSDGGVASGFCSENPSVFFPRAARDFGIGSGY